MKLHRTFRSVLHIVIAFAICTSSSVPLTFAEMLPPAEVVKQAEIPQEIMDQEKAKAMPDEQKRAEIVGEPKLLAAPVGDQAVEQQAAAAADEPPPEPAKIDQAPKPDSFLKELRKSEADLFSGAAVYQYPLWTPQGRLGLTPNLSLTYASTMSSFGSIAGFGWSIPTNAIYRSTERGTDKLYTDKDFTVDIWGNTQELIVINDAQGLYGAETEGDFKKYTFTGANGWEVTDTHGVKYFFGRTAASRQDDPADANRVYKWLLDRVEDPNGNFITFTYFKDQGQVYPVTIRYTGFGADPGNYEIRFTRGNRSAYTDFERGFSVTTRYIIEDVQLYTYHTGAAQLIRTYDIDYASRNTAVYRLASITVRKGAEALPPTVFSYYDQTNAANFERIDYLKQIDYPYGGKEYLDYKPSTAYKFGNNLGNTGLPFVVHTLHRQRIQPVAGGAIYTTQYDYLGGHYFSDQLDAYKKEYAGFHEVTVTDPVGNKHMLYFHQSQFASDNAQSVGKGEFADHISKKGRIYRDEMYDAQNKLFTVSIRKWDKTPLADADPNEERNFVFLSREIQADYDGNASIKAKAKSYTYDSFGNISQETDFGEITMTSDAGDFIDAGNDLVKNVSEYVHNNGAYLHAFAKRHQSFDQQNTLVSESKYFYDGQPFDTITKGSVTQIDRLTESPDTYVTQHIDYNNLGLPVTYTNARNFVTTVSYDARNLYPASVTNPKNQTTSATYNYFFGTPEEVTDPNGARTKNLYDNFGRISDIQVSNPQNPGSLHTREHYDYDLANQPIGIQKVTYPLNSDVNNQVIAISEKSYFDGLGRLLQTRREAEGANQFVVITLMYDSRGNVSKEFLPIFSAGIAYQPVLLNGVGNTYAYDALNRVISVTNPLGTTNTVYDNWENRTTDANSKRKDFVMDARGNLITVREYTGGNPATTRYDYNAQNKLVKITDASGNIRSMTYDVLGRRLSLEDLHTANDTTFGTWTFVYDANGNLQTQTDPKGQSTGYTYDSLDRVTLVDFFGLDGAEQTYTYDQGQYSIGKLSSVSYAAGAQANDSPEVRYEYTYDILGRVVSQKQFVGNRNWTMGFGYDNVGTPVEMTYPDGLMVRNIFDNAGQLEKVEHKDGANFVAVVSGLNYTPTGSITTMTYANGVTSTNTFDINKLYRLTHKQTLKGAQKLQDLDYIYDAVGNITRIADTSQTDTAKTSEYVYDDLYRLTRAEVTGAANNQNYVHTYAYDILGNILNRSDVGDFVYAGGNPATSVGVTSNPHAVTTVAGKNYTYDANGNLTSNSVWTHLYDFANHMIGSTDGQTPVEYTYDHTGKRVMKQNMSNGKSTYYVDKYFDEDFGLTKRFIYAGDMKIATIPKNPNP